MRGRDLQKRSSFLFLSSFQTRDHCSHHPIRSRSKISRSDHRPLLCSGLLSVARIEWRSRTRKMSALWATVAMTTTVILLIIYSSVISDPTLVVIRRGTDCISISICSISSLDNIGGPTPQPSFTCGLTSLLFIVDRRFLPSLQQWYRMINRGIYQSASVLDL
jgi:hypothetical protein